jgi:hypothetical protein
MTRSIVASVLAYCAVILAMAGARAETESRVALAIGNGGYEHLPRLPNPPNDARLIAATLKGLGFTLIGGKEQTDLDRAGFEQAIREFGSRLAGGSVGLFYYAGHGVQVEGVNYLVPISANPATVADVDFELIDAGLVLKQMEAAGSKLNLVLLDACRNNPFGGRGLRGAGGGLAQMRATTGTLISYATQPGSVAMDGNEGNSPYTLALAEAMKKPGIPVLDVFNTVGLAVDKATNGRQQPWLSSSPIDGNFYFYGPATVTVAPPPTFDERQIELAFWDAIKNSTTPADFEDYLKRYPTGAFASLAQRKLDALRTPASRPAAAQISRIRLRQAVLVRESNLDWEWIEKDPRDNREVHFHFQQISSAPTELTLYDKSRDMYARLNFTDHRASRLCKILEKSTTPLVRFGPGVAPMPKIIMRFVPAATRLKLLRSVLASTR